MLLIFFCGNIEHVNTVIKYNKQVQTSESCVCPPSRASVNINIKIHNNFYFFLNNQQDTLINQIYSVIKFYMFRASSLPIIRSFLLYIRHW